MVYLTLSLAWLLFYLCASVTALPIAPVRRATLARALTPDAAPPSIYFTPTEPISRRDIPSRVVARSADDARVLHYFQKRKLFITMLNGGPVESRFVNLLDLWHQAERAIERTPEGSPRRAELVQFQLETATQLTRLMEGVAILQSTVGTPSPTPPLEIDPEPAFTAAESTPTTTEVAPATSPPAQESTSSERILISDRGTTTSSNESQAPQTSSPVAEPAGTPESSPAPAPQPSNPGSANGGVANGNPSPAVTPSPSGSGTPSNTGSGLAEAAQATETVNMGSATSFVRSSATQWAAVGALLVWSSGVL